ncbi:MAG: hypothetical protein WD270_02475 [Acetobacterales bacterium]
MAIGDSSAGMNIAEKYLQARHTGQVQSKRPMESRAPAMSNPSGSPQKVHAEQIGGRYKGRGSYVNIVV